MNASPETRAYWLDIYDYIMSCKSKWTNICPKLVSCCYSIYWYIIQRPGSSCVWSYGSWIYNNIYNQYLSPLKLWVRISLRRDVPYTTLCDKVWKWLMAGWWFSPGTTISSINKTERHHISEILLKVALDTNTLTPNLILLAYTFQPLFFLWPYLNYC